MIKLIDPRKLHFCQVLLVFREALVVNDKDLLLFSFLGIIIVFYFIEMYI